MPLREPARALRIQPNQPLKPFTTFKIGGPARYFASAATAEEFREALAFAAGEGLQLFVLGGGSNILVSDRGFDGLVLHPIQKGIFIVEDKMEAVTLRTHAGETWDDVVRFAVEQGWWGIENLSHIPGQAGAALVQNIGAYGQQISDVFRGVEVMEAASGEVRNLAAPDCGFGYRRSIFNSEAKGTLIILSLTLSLGKRGRPNPSYPDVQAYLTEHGVREPSISQVRQAIIRIRDRKFPFPREERGGNAGSFFKNLQITENEYETLRANLQQNSSAQELNRLEQIRNRFPLQDRIKIPTAFLIEICGLKGARSGGARVNETQPLVLLNDGGATARDVMTLAKKIRQTIHARTRMVLSLEPELVGFTAEETAEFMALN